MYILCESSNNRNACGKAGLHAEKEENFVHKTGGHFIMAKNMDGTNKSENSYGQNISPQTDPQTKLLIAITKRSSTENRLLHNM